MLAWVYSYPIAECRFRFSKVEQVHTLREMVKPKHHFSLKEEGVHWRSSRELYGEGSLKRERNGKVNQLFLNRTNEMSTLLYGQRNPGGTMSVDREVLVGVCEQIGSRHAPSLTTGCAVSSLSQAGSEPITLTLLNTESLRHRPSECPLFTLGTAWLKGNYSLYTNP